MIEKIQTYFGGYKNLFDYCTRRLNLSEGTVALRIELPNVSRRSLQALAALAETG